MAHSNGRSTHEIVVNDNPPSTDQLFRLASHAMVAARETHTHRVMKTTPRAHFSKQEVHYYNDAAAMVFDDYPAQIRRLLAIRIGRRTLGSVPVREWSLKFFDTSWYERPGGNWYGVRDRYRFEWVQERVTLAERTSLFVPSGAASDMYHDLEHFTITDDFAEILHAEQEMSQVTANDMEHLIADTAAYYRMSQGDFADRASNDSPATGA